MVNCSAAPLCLLCALPSMPCFSIRRRAEHKRRRFVLRCFQVIIKIGSVISVDFQNLRFFIFMNMNGRPACPPAARPGKRKRGAKNDLGKAGLNAQCYSSIHSMMFYGLPLFAPVCLCLHVQPPSAKMVFRHSKCKNSLTSKTLTSTRS